MTTKTVIATALTACVAIRLPATEVPKKMELFHLAQPCKAKNILAGLVIRDRADDRERLVLTNTNEYSGLELIFVDFERNESKVIRAPAGQGAWALAEVPDDRLVVGTYYDGQFVIFDLKKMKFTKHVGFPGETYIWQVALGSDGRLYGGTYGGGKLLALDLRTYTVEDCGAPAPPNLYLRNVSALPNGHILCRLGLGKPTTLIYDPSAKQFYPPPEHLADVTAGVSWGGVFLVGALAYDGKTLEPTPFPFPIPPAEKGDWQVDISATSLETLVLRQGTAIYTFNKHATSLQLVADIDLRGGSPIASSATGKVFGIRGQDYFILEPGGKFSLRPIPAESSPRPILFLRADGEGRLWGGPHFGQTLFHTDSSGKHIVNTGTVCDEAGEVYDVAFLNGKVFAASYGGGDIICYDPQHPWNQIGGKNPRNLAHLASRGYIRPSGSIRVGPDGMLYTGLMARYGVYGGAVAITHPITGKTDLIENPLGEQDVAGLVLDTNFLYVGTSLGANGLPDKEGESPSFGIIELSSRQVIYSHHFEGARIVRPLEYDKQTGLVALAVDGTIHLFDSKKRKFINNLPADIPRVQSYSVAAPGDTHLYYGSSKSLIQLNLATHRAKIIAECTNNISNVTADPDGRLYVSSGIDVYAVR